MLMTSAEDHSTMASEHRLSKPARKANFENAATYKTEKNLARLRAAKNTKSQKTQEMDSQIKFLVYMHYYDLKKHLNTMPMQPVNVSLSPTLSLDDAVEEVLARTRGAFLANPETRQWGWEPSFKLDDVEFSSRPSKNVVSEGILFKDILGQTLGKYFKTLMSSNKLSVVDERRRTISVKLILFESTALKPTESEDSDEDSNMRSLTSKRKKKQKNVMNLKKARSSSDAESMSDEPWNPANNTILQSQSTPPPPRPPYTRMVTRSVARLLTNEDPSLIPNTVDSTAIKRMDDQTILGEFRTPYHCHPHSHASHRTSGYDVYLFHRISAIVTPDGEIQLIKSNMEEGVVVHKNWPACVKQGKCPERGWLGKGMRKYCFKGYIGQQQFALFQLGGYFFFSGVDNRTHSRIIVDEYRSLIMSNYLLNVFKQRAQFFNVPLPAVRFHIEDTFIGELVNYNAIPAPPFGSSETRSMLNTTFMAAPFVDFGDQSEIRYIGGDGEWRAEEFRDEMDSVLQAFVHSVLVDTAHALIVTDIQGIFMNNGELLLFDPQIHSLDKHWWRDDAGIEVINKFLAEHKCNKYCEKLQLEGKSPESVLPFSHSMSPAQPLSPALVHAAIPAHASIPFTAIPGPTSASIQVQFPTPLPVPASPTQQYAATPVPIEPAAGSGSMSVGVPPAELLPPFPTRLRTVSTKPILPPIISLLQTPSCSSSAPSHRNGPLRTGWSPRKL
ncbi:hypothetical protein M422DRAFT_240129 [Sphaerobolus stellatus SS14]|uniref:Alpha-type protein kinase domain-containing protein n=1 Tax=Sphaerobolus stellatus (strain SS14) TaxID=990650 RepID=A0A0C9VX98_SPHS4|nr:hypothetical protein M422DRAFT_253343 [Sphaerobolus stellatus SS14]KIJ49665.1 hypothetical protein M422DRAFT_246736 [Sphaerobolus stellatus SS14]KIJ55514.1 hypothetical protein M422DRAFT_240129 [Sphaerobolus stellatus SS14]